MKKFTFNSGAEICIDGQALKIGRMMEDGRLLLERPDGSMSSESHAKLLEMYSQRRLTFVANSSAGGEMAKALYRPLFTYPEKIQAQAIRRKKYIDFIRQYGPIPSTPQLLRPLITLCATSINDPTPPSPSSIYRWNRQLTMAQDDMRSLICRFHLRGGSGSRLKPEIQMLLQEAIEQVYLSPQRNTVEETCSHLDSLIANANKFRDLDNQLVAPGRVTVWRAIKGLDKYDTAVARHGIKVANMEFRVSGRGPQASRILERVEIDHTPLDLL
ncbi:hypothetical protein [Duganella hordei]|uniref:hypothetical protein n=1 Tax=Duganella hordei TaxID=2865934 RepID=UPI0030E83EF3